MLKLSNAGVSPTHKATAINHLGEQTDVRIAGERPLSIKIDDQELVTLMTLGSNPEDLALGYVRNQGIVENIEAIKSVKVDWEKETADIRTVSGNGLKGLEDRLSKPKKRCIGCSPSCAAKRTRTHWMNMVICRH